MSDRNEDGEFDEVAGDSDGASPNHDAPDDEAANEQDDPGRLDAIRRALGSIQPPEVPVTIPWEISIAGLLRSSFEIPSLVSRALGQLDRFGALRVAPTSIGIDKDDVEWAKVTAIRTRSLADALASSVIEREIERLTKLLPPAPGRKRLAGRVASVLRVAADAALQKVPGEAPNRRVVSEIDYRASLGRTRTLASGLVVTSVARRDSRRQRCHHPHGHQDGRGRRD